MAVEKKFIAKALDDLEVKNFLQDELKRASVSSVALQKTPIATRITICVRRPSVVVGRRGRSINELSEKLRRKFGIENPQIEVVEVMKPDLDAQLVAEKISHRIEMRPRVKPILRFALKDIMESGAIGAEIRAAGKIVGKGGKAREFVVRSGYIKKSGDSVKLVRTGTCTAFLKAGTVGITVKIVPPGTVFPDQVKIEAPKKVVEEEATIEGEAEKEGKPKADKKEESKEEKTAEKKEKIEEAAEEKPEKEEPEEKQAKEKKKPKKKAAKKTEEKESVEEKGE